MAPWSLPLWSEALLIFFILVGLPMLLFYALPLALARHDERASERAYRSLPPIA